MKIRITPGAILMFAAMLVAGDRLFLAGVLAAAVHECGHLLAARLLHIPLRLLELDIGGARILPVGEPPTFLSQGLLAAAGPAASLLLALLLHPIIPPNGVSFCLLLQNSTLSLALFNLLPISGFDGGNILSALLTPRLAYGRAQTVCRACAYLSLLLLFSLSACLLLRYGENMPLAVFCASLFARLFLQENS